MAESTRVCLNDLRGHKMLSTRRDLRNHIAIPPSAVSIETNIAEGYKNLSKADKLRFMNIAQGSIEECRDYLILTRDLTYIDNDCFKELHNALEDASRLLYLYCKGIANNNGIKS